MSEWGDATDSAGAGTSGDGVQAAYWRLFGLAERMERTLGRPPRPDIGRKSDAGPVDDEVRVEGAIGAAAMRRMAHGARQELTVIKGRAQLLRRRVLAARTPDLVVLRGLEAIDRAVDRLDALIAANLDPPPRDDGAPRRP
jgi:signal transduction histidine kinase